MGYDYTTFYSDTGEINSTLNSVIPTTPFVGLDTQNRPHDYIEGNYSPELYYISDPTNTKVPTLKTPLSSVVNYSFSGATHTWINIPVNTLFVVIPYEEIPSFGPPQVRVDLLPMELPPPTIIDDGDADLSIDRDGLYLVRMTNLFYLPYEFVVSVGGTQFLATLDVSTTHYELNADQGTEVDTLEVDEIHDNVNNVLIQEQDEEAVVENYEDITLAFYYELSTLEVDETNDNLTHVFSYELSHYDEFMNHGIVDLYFSGELDTLEVVENNGDLEAL